MKGIVLAGGAGTRLFPSTLGVSKQLLPIYDKPMVYYPLSVLMLAGIREILIITTPEDENCFRKLLKDGSQFGVKFEYVQQQRPDGLAQSFILGEEFIGDAPVCLVLGDNIFYGGGFSGMLKRAKNNAKQGRASIFAYKVKNPDRFGVIAFDNDCKVMSIEEKPPNPKSNYAVTGLYFYPQWVSELAKTLEPSLRGEYEITDLNRLYLNKGILDVQIFPRGFAWLDTGCHSALLKAGQYVQTLEENQGIKIACLEEIALGQGFITKQELINNISGMGNSEYYEYIRRL